MKPTIAVLYGDAAGAALVDAIRHWRKEYAPGHPYEGLIGGPIRVVQSKVRLTEGPKASVVVSIEGRRYGSNDEYYYEAELVAGALKLLSILDDDELDV